MILSINRVVFLPYGDFISIGPSWSGEVGLLIPKPLSVNWIFQHSCYVLSSISAETEGGKMDWAGARHFQLLGETSQLHFHSCSLEVREQTITILDCPSPSIDPWRSSCHDHHYFVQRWGLGQQECQRRMVWNHQVSEL